MHKILMLISMVMFAIPSFGYVENNDPCTDDTLNTYSGSANLTANWDANEIELHWYNGNDEIENIASVSQSCVYDGTLTPPATIPTREGYTFRGWRARQACSFSSSVCGLDRSATDGLSIANFEYITNNAQSTNNAGNYGLTSTGSWAVEFTDGSIARGIASCNNTESNILNTIGGQDNWSIEKAAALWGACNTDTFKSTNTFNTSSTGRHCWCRLTSYTPHGATACNVSSSAWVFDTVLESASECALRCSSYCCEDFHADTGYGYYKRALFGVQ